ncbi:phosphotransferase [Streptomyces roseolilacinus]|uniref:phosphotransferase n=1 Tax=Streptomyces roseolilacinus TaxID=66904 RepID=UPI003802CA85
MLSDGTAVHDRTASPDRFAGAPSRADPLPRRGTDGLGGAPFAGTASEDEPVCHGDFGPWNVVWNGGAPTGLLDFDYARPAPRLHDVACALEYVAPFRPDAECVRRLGHAGPPDRRRRLEVFADAYGLTDTTGLVDAVIAVQHTTRDLVRSPAAQGHQPQADRVRAGLLDTPARRAAWSRAHRPLFAWTFPGPPGGPGPEAREGLALREATRAAGGAGRGPPRPGGAPASSGSFGTVPVRACPPPSRARDVPGGGAGPSAGKRVAPAGRGPLGSVP